jgi:hypothetical protein
MSEDLLALAERVEQATGPCRNLDNSIRLATNGGCAFDEDPAYTASLDAAMTLVPEGWNWMAGNRNQPKARAYVNNGELHFEGVTAQRNPRLRWCEVVAATPALALTAAALRARTAMEPTP